MFFKRKDFIDFKDKIMRKNRIPILIHDKQWKQLFSNNMNKNMESLSKELGKLIKEEKELEKELKNSQHRKRIIMNKIIHLSDKLNIKGQAVDTTEMENAKNEISSLNEDIDKIRESLEEYPQKIEDINIELVEETANLAYLEIDEAESRIKVVDNEIELLRERLGEYRDEREALDKRAQTLYSVLHSIIGSEEIEKLDEKFFK